MNKIEKIILLRDYTVSWIESFDEDDQMEIIPNLLINDIYLDALFALDDNLLHKWIEIKKDKDAVKILEQSIKSHLWDILLEDGEINRMIF